jgi:hypothetical protein
MINIANFASRSSTEECYVNRPLVNCLPITKGWNDMVRRYRPRAEILDDK